MVAIKTTPHNAYWAHTKTHRVCVCVRFWRAQPIACYFVQFVCERSFKGEGGGLDFLFNLQFHNFFLALTLSAFILPHFFPRSHSLQTPHYSGDVCVNKPANDIKIAVHWNSVHLYNYTCKIGESAIRGASEVRKSEQLCERMRHNNKPIIHYWNKVFSSLFTVCFSLISLAVVRFCIFYCCCWFILLLVARNLQRFIHSYTWEYAAHLYA